MESPTKIHRDWLSRLPGQGVFVTPAVLVEAEAFPTSPVYEIAATLRRVVGEDGTFTDPTAFLFEPTGLAWPRGGEAELWEETAHFVAFGSGTEGEKLLAVTADVDAFADIDSLPTVRPAILGALRSADPGAPWAALVLHDRGPAFDVEALAATRYAIRLGSSLGAGIVVMFRGRAIQVIAPGASPAWLSFPLEALLSEDGLVLGALHMLIGERRLLSLPEEKRLPALLAASRQTRIQSLRLARLTVFEQTEMALCTGINVIIGPNGSGKSHALKALYALCRGLAPDGDIYKLPAVVNKLLAVMRPDENKTERLVRWGAEQAAEVEVRSERGADFAMRFRGLGGSSGELNSAWSGPARVVYLPTREVLSLYELLATSYSERQTSIDETLWDACQALATPLLREPPDTMRPLLARLERIVGGEIVLRNNRFYLRTPDRDVEAPLLAEGIRKLAGLARLVANGSIAPGGLLIWDEPEGNLNPVLVTKAADLLIDLAKQGIQIVVASHDYLFVRHLSLMAEHKKHPDVPIRFFGFCPTPDRGVVIEQGDTLADLDHNPILDEFTRHVEREQALVFGAD